MALICYYAQHYIAYTQAKSGIALDVFQPTQPMMFNKNDPVLSCCMASRVRRSTAATGE